MSEKNWEGGGKVSFFIHRTSYCMVMYPVILYRTRIIKITISLIVIC